MSFVTKLAEKEFSSFIPSLNSSDSRTVQISIDNQTGQTMHLSSSDIKHGDVSTADNVSTGEHGFPSELLITDESKSEDKDAADQNTFDAESHGASDGPEGNVSWIFSVDTKTYTFNLSYHHPHGSSTSAYYASLSCFDSANSSDGVQNNIGNVSVPKPSGGHHQELTITVGL